MLASVIVLAYRSAEALEECLASLATHRSVHCFETILVLNGASTDVIEVADRHPEVLVVRSVANRGFAGGCNLGASKARGKYLVFLNDDAIVTEGWLDGLVHTAATVPRAGAVSSLILDPDGMILEYGGRLDGLVASAVDERGRSGYRAELLGPRLVSYASGCSLLIDRDLFESIDGFDERFHPAYYEDTDLSRRIWEAGRLVVATPASNIRHLESESTNHALKQAMSDISKAKFERKWLHSPNIGRRLPDPLPRIVYMTDAAQWSEAGSDPDTDRRYIEALTSLGIFVQLMLTGGPRPVGLDPAMRSMGVMIVRSPGDLRQSPPPLAVVISSPSSFGTARELAGIWHRVPVICTAEAFDAALVRPGGVQPALLLAGSEQEAERLHEVTAASIRLLDPSDADLAPCWADIVSSVSSWTPTEPAVTGL